MTQKGGSGSHATFVRGRPPGGPAEGMRRHPQEALPLAHRAERSARAPSAHHPAVTAHEKEAFGPSSRGKVPENLDDERRCEYSVGPVWAALRRSLKERLAVCGGDDGAPDVYEDSIWVLPLDIPGLSAIASEIRRPRPSISSTMAGTYDRYRIPRRPLRSNARSADPSHRSSSSRGSALGCSLLRGFKPLTGFEVRHSHATAAPSI